MNHSVINNSSNLTTLNDSFHEEISKKPFHVSNEYDTMRENFFCKDDIDRSQWIEKLFSNYPDIKEFRQKIMPVDRAIEFGNLYLPEERLINQETIFSLISQHFRTLGLINSQQSLHQEWDGIFDFPISLNQSQLEFLIQRGIQNSENFWTLITPGSMSKNDNEDEKVIEEFEKIIGKEISSEFSIKDSSPFNLDKPGDPNELIFDKDDQLIKATINQIIWLYTTNNKFKFKQLMEATCLLSSSLIKDTRIMFLKIRERFKIAIESETILPNFQIKYDSQIDKPNPVRDFDIITEEELSNLQITDSIKSETTAEVNEKTKDEEKENQLTPQTKFTENQYNQIKKTLNLLSIWLDQCGPQIPQPVFSSVISFIHNEVPIDFSKQIEKIQLLISRIINQRNQLNESNSDDANDFTQTQPPPKVELDYHHMPWSPNFELINLPPIEFARQLTIFISKYFNQINRCELVYSNDDEIEENQPNLTNLINKGNNFFRWIQFYVLSKSEISERSSMINYFIKVAKKLFEIQNYYGCSLILNTFDNAFASLKATKALIAKNDLIFIEEAKNQIVNFSTDSSVIRQFFNESLSKTPTIPVIFPYKSSIQSAIKGRLFEDDKIKIPVLLEIFKLVCEFEEFQKKKYNFYVIDQAQELLDKCNSPKTLNELIDYAKKVE